MIYNQWYIILASTEVDGNQPKKVKRLNEQLVVWRGNDGKVACISDRCCHRGVSLACGKVVDGKVECPFHGFLFAPDGRVVSIPANGKNASVPESMKNRSYETFERDGFVWIWYGDKEKITHEPFYFDDVKGFSHTTIKDKWCVHYSRAIENQLDVVHLPFVHRTTIGRGNKTLVNGPVVERDEDMITFYVDNVVDDGTTVPLKPGEIKDYKRLFFLKFHFPNVWQNYISEKIRFVAAFVPVDEENCEVYIRYYQRVINVPVLKQLVNRIGVLSGLIILRQDKRVVITQQPKKSELKSDEKLIMGDLPIVEYRKHRQTLMDKGVSN